MAKTSAELETPPEETGRDLHLEFPDNRLLIDLCGSYDANLARIEASLGVVVLRRGNELAIHGEPAMVARAGRALAVLYERLEKGRAVEPGDVDAAIRMAGPDEDTPPEPGDQIEMFAADRLEIRTRKKTIEPRTPAQRGYVEALYGHELVFGLGP
ncbi:MAG: phosphate starvation-inducible protein PhoH, partial [Pseudomonadota bacterium]